MSNSALLAPERRLMRSVTFTARGTPKPQPRPKFRTTLPSAQRLEAIGLEAVSEASGGDPWKIFRRKLVSETRSTAYDPGSADAWRKAVADAWVATGEKPLTGPLSISIELLLGRKASKVSEWDTRNGSPGGDWDNFAKAICDALNGLAYEDDSLIVLAVVTQTTGPRDKGIARITIAELRPFAELCERIGRWFIFVRNLSK